MLEERDLEAIRNIMKSELTESENMVLKEVDRIQEKLEIRMGKIERNLEDLKQYYRIAHLESDNTTMMLQMIR